MAKSISKREKKKRAKKAKVQRAALGMSDRQLLRSAKRAYERRTAKPKAPWRKASRSSADQASELPPRPGQHFKPSRPRGEKCLAYMPHFGRTNARRCGRKVVIPGYCEEHRPKRGPNLADARSLNSPRSLPSTHSTITESLDREA